MSFQRLKAAVGNPALQERLSTLGLNESVFMTLDQPRLLSLVERHGQEKVLRELSIIEDLHGKNWIVKHQAQTLIETFLSSAIPDPAIMEECPVCTQPACRLSKCKSCGFSFVEDFRCPRMQPGRICSCSGQLCEELGLEFETCEVFENSLSPVKIPDDDEISESHLIEGA